MEEVEELEYVLHAARRVVIAAQEESCESPMDSLKKSISLGHSEGVITDAYFKKGERLRREDNSTSVSYTFVVKVFDFTSKKKKP